MADGHQDVIRHALRVARDRGFTEVRLAFEDTSFEAVLSPFEAAPVASAESKGVVEAVDSGLVEITSPVVGYVKDSGDGLKVGQKVEKGAAVAIVAALGLANDVESPASGEIVEVLVEAGQPVEYGQPLATVRPA